ncbi:MAG: hypothetical protein IKO47_00885 [Ruminococcus sp.]|nr:hypothetical protein [Ruminococcus sp.]
MSIFTNFKKKLLKGAQNNLSLAIYSIILAILVWFVISMTFYPSVPKTIQNVKLKIDISGTAAAESGLSVIDWDVDTVDVKIRGSRTQVGNMNSDSLIAYVDADNITTTGKKTLTIKIKGNSNISYEVDSISPSTVNVVFDKYETAEFHIYPKTPNITLAEGKTIDSEESVCEPDVLTITGPSAQINKIAKCYAVSSKAEELSASYTVPNDSIELYAEDGSLLDQENLTFNKTSFLIKVPVLTQKNVDLNVNITNIPAKFDTSWLMDRITLSKDSILIASGSTQTDLPSKLEIGSIKLSDIILDYSATFNVSKVLENAGLKNISGIENVTVTFDSSGLASREFKISQENISIRNKPSSDYDYTVVSDSVRITVIGPEEVLSELTASDFLVEADLLGSDTAASNDNIAQFSNDVTITCPDFNNVWSITKSKVMIQKTAKQQTHSDSE